MTQGVSVPVITVDPAVLRTAQIETVLRPGMVLAGRVTERVGAHGLLLLHGAPVVAQLPEGVDAGARLRLRVAVADADSIVLQVLPDAVSPQASAATGGPTAAAFALALPGGMHAQVRVDPDGGAEPGGPGTARAASVSLRLDTPALGRLDLRLDTATCAVHVSAGAPAQAAREAAGALQDALVAATGRPVLVTVHPRMSALDVSA
jgi:hypothetical protein